MIITERKKIKHNTDNKEPKELYIGFATNSSNVDVQKYAKRWGIETGYRMIESTRSERAVPAWHHVNSVYYTR